MEFGIGIVVVIVILVVIISLIKPGSDSGYDDYHPELGRDYGNDRHGDSFFGC